MQMVCRYRLEMESQLLVCGIKKLDVSLYNLRWRIVLLLIEISKEGEGQGDTNSRVFYELQGLRNQKEKIEASYHEIFPKADPYLVHDLVLRMYQDSVKNKNI